MPALSPPGSSLLNMEELLPSLIGQVVPLLIAIFGLLAGIVVKSGSRRRLDNLKAGAETLKAVTDPRDEDAVRKYMEKQRVALTRTVDFRMWYLGSVALAVYLFMPLVAEYYAPGTARTDLWAYYGTPVAFVLALPVIYFALIDAKPVGKMLYEWVRKTRRSSSEEGTVDDATQRL